MLKNAGRKQVRAGFNMFMKFVIALNKTKSQNTWYSHHPCEPRNHIITQYMQLSLSQSWTNRVHTPTTNHGLDTDGNFNITMYRAGIHIW